MPSFAATTTMTAAATMTAATAMAPSTRTTRAVTGADAMIRVFVHVTVLFPAFGASLTRTLATW